MIHISSNKCVGCGLCIEACPTQCLSMAGGIARLAAEECRNCNRCTRVCPQGAIVNSNANVLVAITTDDGTRVQTGEHFGAAEQYQIWSCGHRDARYIETRENAKYPEDESITHGDPGKAKATAATLEEVEVLVSELFGPNITRLKDRFVCAVVRGNRTIEEALALVRENMGEILEEKAASKHRGMVLKGL